MELKEFNLLEKAERVRNLMYLIRVASVISALKDVIPNDERFDFLNFVR